MPVTVFTSSYQPTSCPHQHLVAIWTSLFLSLFLFVVIFIQTAPLSRVFMGKSWVGVSVKSRLKSSLIAQRLQVSNFVFVPWGLYGATTAILKWNVMDAWDNNQKPLCEHLHRHVESSCCSRRTDRVPSRQNRGQQAGRGKVLTHAQSWWTLFHRCWTFDLKMAITLSSPSRCCCLHSPPDANWKVVLRTWTFKSSCDPLVVQWPINYLVPCTFHIQILRLTLKTGIWWQPECRF